MDTKHTDTIRAAFGSMGEQARDWAYDQLAKLRPGGANYRRLRALQDAGEAVSNKPSLYAAAPKLLEALTNLLSCCELNLDEMEPGTINRVKEARAALAEAEKE